MRNLLISLLILLGFVSSARAQKEPPGKENPMLNELKKELNLTAEQVKQIESIFESNFKKMEPPSEKKHAKPNDRKKPMDSIHEKIDSEIEKILTKEQQKKYKTIVENRISEMKKKMPPPDDDSNHDRNNPPED